MRERFIKEGVDKDSIARGLTGLDSPQAWEMREQFIKEGVDKDYIAIGLAGLDSSRAWEMRERFIKEGVDKYGIAGGLAGLDSPRAWEMRQRLIKEGAHKDCIAAGLAGDHITFVWQLNKKTTTGESNRKVKLLNLLNTFVPVRFVAKEEKITSPEKVEYLSTEDINLILKKVPHGDLDFIANWHLSDQEAYIKGFVRDGKFYLVAKYLPLIADADISFTRDIIDEVLLHPELLSESDGYELFRAIFPHDRDFCAQKLATLEREGVAHLLPGLKFLLGDREALEASLKDASTTGANKFKDILHSILLADSNPTLVKEYLNTLRKVEDFLAAKHVETALGESKPTLWNFRQHTQVFVPKAPRLARDVIMEELSRETESALLNDLDAIAAEIYRYQKEQSQRATKQEKLPASAYLSKETIEKLLKQEPDGKLAFVMKDLPTQKKIVTDLIAENLDVSMLIVGEYLPLLATKDLHFAQSMITNILGNRFHLAHAEQVIIDTLRRLRPLDGEYFATAVENIDKDENNWPKEVHAYDIMLLKLEAGLSRDLLAYLEEKLNDSTFEYDDINWMICAAPFGEELAKKYIQTLRDRGQFQEANEIGFALGWWAPDFNNVSLSQVPAWVELEHNRRAAATYIREAKKTIPSVVDQIAAELYTYEMTNKISAAVENESEYETKYLTEEKILDTLEVYLKEWVSRYFILRSMCGLDSDRAWQIREEHVDMGSDYRNAIVEGLCGLDSPRAWEMRERLIREGVSKSSIALGLAGLDSDRSWEMRERLLKEGVDKVYIATNLVGLDSPRAWEMRERFIKERVDKGVIARGLAGLDSPRAWEMREQFIKHGYLRNWVALGLAGLDSPRAWEMRERLLKEGVDKDKIAISLAGLDSDRAWEMRERLLKEGVDKDKIAMSLAGLDSDRAWEMRERLRMEGVSKECIVQGLAGDYTTFVWQLLKKKKAVKIESKNLVSTAVEKEFDGPELSRDINHYLANDSVLAERNRQTGVDKIKTMVETSRQIGRGMTAVMWDIPGQFLRTMSAKKDKRLTAEKLATKTFPSTLWRKESPWRGYDGYSGFSADSSGTLWGTDPANYLNPSSMDTMMGGDPENVPDVEVMRFREPIGDLIVTGIYGCLSGNSWDASYQFPISPSPVEKSKDITITLPHVNRQVKLPKPLDANIISERVKGIKGGKEIPLPVDISALGEGLVSDTKSAQEVVFSLETDEVPRMMLDVSAEQYGKFRQGFVRAHQDEMLKPLVELPEDIDLFLQEIKAKPPKEQVELIEQYVRSISFYDNNNGEVIPLKKNKSLDERLEIMEARVDELRERYPDREKSFDGKKYAGVCADFAVLAAAILRRAGFLAGVVAGFLPSGKSVKIENAHSTAFVAWPNGRGGNEIFSVDGTPHGLPGISRPSLREMAVVREQMIVEVKKESQEKLDEIMNVLTSNDTEAIKKLTNGDLEKVLNTVLRYEVKQENMQAITGMLQAYWYSQLHKLDLDEPHDKVQFIKFFEAEIKQARQTTGSLAADPGSQLFETVETFAKKFADGDSTQSGLLLINKITDLVRDRLSETEQKALAAITTYLKAKKMKG
ncbi:MAG: transglutaminase domain-containing protein [Candidatus Komeilibacteria bacterium]|nr:transglutaminase domain-containing protein [Candidatus Komeilibacteria bacterium]